MHEFSLAQNIVEIVEDAVTQNHASKATEVVIEIGELAGVEFEALKTAMESWQPGTLLENAEIHYKIKEGLARCRQCGKEFRPESLFAPCPQCNAYGCEVTEGKNLFVKSITAE